jgi:cell division protein FtsB
VSNNWVLLFAGVLVGGGGVGGLLSAFFSRSRDKTVQKTTDVQVGLAVLKEAIVTLKDENASLRARIKELESKPGGRR